VQAEVLTVQLVGSPQASAVVWVWLDGPAAATRNATTTTHLPAPAPAPAPPPLAPPAHYTDAGASSAGASGGGCTPCRSCAGLGRIPVILRDRCTNDVLDVQIHPATSEVDARPRPATTTTPTAAAAAIQGGGLHTGGRLSVRMRCYGKQCFRVQLPTVLAAVRTVRSERSDVVARLVGGVEGVGASTGCCLQCRAADGWAGVVTVELEVRGRKINGQEVTVWLEP
jgi:hypothetical protein